MARDSLSAQVDPAAAAAEAFASAVAGEDHPAYIRLFTAAYNIAHSVGSEEPEAARARASEILQKTSATRRAPSRLRTLAEAVPSGDEPAPSILDDPVFVENSRYVIGADTRILGGAPAPDFQDCVAIGKPEMWCCSGTLIAPTLVVTAGHCAAGGCSQRVFFGTDVNDPGGGRIVEVAQVVPHPTYQPPQPFNDLSLLILAEAVDGIVPRQLAADGAVGASSSVRLVGYGTTEPTGRAGYGLRRFVDVPLASSDPRYGAAPESEFVAGRPFLDRDSCPGDSGGPAYLEDTGSWRLAGATSRGTPGPRPERECGDGGIYTQVPRYRDWIESVGGPLPRQ